MNPDHICCETHAKMFEAVRFMVRSNADVLRYGVKNPQLLVDVLVKCVNDALPVTFDTEQCINEAGKVGLAIYTPQLGCLPYQACTKPALEQLEKGCPHGLYESIIQVFEPMGSSIYSGFTMQQPPHVTVNCTRFMLKDGSAIDEADLVRKTMHPEAVVFCEAQLYMALAGEVAEMYEEAHKMITMQASLQMVNTAGDA
jgi:hypothetical protein